MATRRMLWRDLLQVVGVGAVVAIVVAVCLIGVLKVTLFSLQDAQGTGESGDAASTASGGEGSGSLLPISPSGLTTGTSPAPTIQLDDVTAPVSAHRIVRLTGQAPAADESRSLQVQLRAPRGWITFPVPAVTGSTGRFTAYVELGRPGPNRLRVIDPATADVSNIVTVTVG
jgi:hypothetical protein